MLVKTIVLKHYSCYCFSLVKTNFTQYSVLTLNVFRQYWFSLVITRINYIIFRKDWSYQLNFINSRFH
jgi:hypothetical protein